MAPQLAEAVTWTDALQGVGTAGALIFSLLVAYLSNRDARSARAELLREKKFATAGLVSAWVEVKYAPAVAGDAYERTAILYVANGAREPVFQVTVLVSVGTPHQALGPLAAPDVIATLPPGRTLSWDISVALRAREDTSDPRAEVTFRDASQREWCRELDGALVERTGEPVGLVETSNLARAFDQVGPLIASNPVAVALAFLNAVGDDGDEILELVTPGSPMEAALLAGDAEVLRSSLVDWSLAGQARYPAPRVAYVKVLDPLPSAQVNVGGPHPVLSRVLTLVNPGDDGSWSIYEFGRAVEPDRIAFPVGTL